jgi:hypothetical protein
MAPEPIPLPTNSKSSVLSHRRDKEVNSTHRITGTEWSCESPSPGMGRNPGGHVPLNPTLKKWEPPRVHGPPPSNPHALPSGTHAEPWPLPAI